MATWSLHDPLTVLSCKWRFHFILVEKAMFQMGKIGSLQIMVGHGLIFFYIESRRLNINSQTKGFGALRSPYSLSSVTQKDEKGEGFAHKLHRF